MAPPTKRRRLPFWSDTVDESSGDDEAMGQITRHGFTHAITEIVTEHAVEDMGSDAEQYIIERQAVDASAVTATDVTVVAVDVATAVTTSVAGDVSAAAAVSTSLAIDLSASASVPLSVSTSLVSVNTPLSVDAQTSSVTSLSSLETSALGSVSQTASLASSTSAASSTSTPASSSQPTGISSANTATSITITSSLPVIASSLVISSTSSSKNITVAENILTNALNGTSITTLSSSSTGIISSGFYSNTSYTYVSPSLTSTSDSMDGDVATSVVLTTATLSSDGQPATTITTAVGAGVAGYGTQATATGAGSISTSDSSSASPPPPPGTIAGGVVGGAAGIAVLLLVAMLFLRWYRRRAQGTHKALMTEPAGAYQDSPDLSCGPGMAERAGIRPWAAAIPAMLRHQNQKREQDNAVLAAPQERSFQRISGRKLPSAWSPGIEGSVPPMPYGDAYRGSGASSYYPPSHTEPANPFLDSSDHTTPEDEVVPNRQPPEQMTVVPGPQRRPTIHNPQRHPTIAGADTRIKHISSVARTSGTATTLLSSESLLHPGHAGYFKEDV